VVKPRAPRDSAVRADRSGFAGGIGMRMEQREILNFADFGRECQHLCAGKSARRLR